MNLGERAPRRAAAIAISILVAGGIGLVAPGHASLSAPSTSSVAPASSESTAPTTLPLTLDANGEFTEPGGTFAVRFDAVPTQVIDSENSIVSYLIGVDDDTQSVIIFTPDAFGATQDTTVGERADLFLAASGTDIDPLANTTTRLGPYPAAHFIARLTLGDGQRAVVYGLVVARANDVVYAFYTDAAGDDNPAGTAFVESFTLVMAQPPLPTTSTTTSTVPLGLPVETVGTTTTVPTTTDPAAPSTTTTTPPPAPPSTVATAPAGATLGYDGRWWVTFPEGAAPTFRASTEVGFAYAEYLAVDGDDTLIVRVTEVPAGFEWIAAGIAEAEAERVGGVVQSSEIVDVGGHEAVRFTFTQDDSGTSGDTTQVLVTNGGDRIYRVIYEDGGTTSTSDADEFIESFELA